MKTLQELAALLGGAVTREPGLEIHGVNGLDDAREGDITFVANPKYASKLAATRASAVIALPEVAKSSRIPAITVANPDMAFLTAARCFAPPEVPAKPGVHATAVVGAGAAIAKSASVGPLCVIGDGAVIGEGAVLDAQVYVGPEARIGAGSRLYPQVSVRERCIIGDRVILHCGVVIGSDGFGYVPINGVHVKIPQRGIVVIEDDVEIGANTTVDRARIDKTWIRKGVKIDNLCQVAHNVVIGEGSLIVAQVGISGSTQLGRYVVLAGQVGVTGHLQVPDGVRVGAQSGLGHNPEPGQAVSGSPARPHLQNQREQVAISRLPELLKEVSALRKRVEELEGKR